MRADMLSQETGRVFQRMENADDNFQSVVSDNGQI
jgi:hypothetical protein